MSEAAVNYAFEQLQASAPPPRDAAARLLAEATAQAEQIREQARAQGHAEGRSAGHADGLSRDLGGGCGARRGSRRASRRCACTRPRRSSTTRSSSPCRSPQKILAGAFQARPELVVEVVQGALRRINDRRRIEVLVNPADLETVRSAIGDRSEIGQQAQVDGIELCDLRLRPAGRDRRGDRAHGRGRGRRERADAARARTRRDRDRARDRRGIRGDRPGVSDGATPGTLLGAPPRRSARRTSPAATASSAT